MIFTRSILLSFFSKILEVTCIHREIYEKMQSSVTENEQVEKPTSTVDSENNTHINTIITSLPSQGSEQKKIDKIVLMSKNDSIKKRVLQISSLLSQKKSVLVIGKCSAISKTISIIEIVKKCLIESKIPFVQLNKIDATSSSSNPLYKNKSLMTLGKKKKSMMSPSGIPRSTTFILPNIYIILSSPFVLGSLNGWTYQGKLS